MRWIFAGCVAAAALSLLLGGRPTYDPWAWIIWGREITEGTLDTRSGPSWKPLPMLFTAPFALAGDDAAPGLWLVVSRAGGILALVMAFRLGTRLAGPVAGAVAVAGLFFSEGFVRHAARGFSEGLLVGLVLLAVDRHLAGQRRAAFVAGLGAALLRPEVWPFWGIYGLWLGWTDPRARALVAGGFAAIPLGWFLPEYLGSGDPLRAAARALQPNLDSPAFADRPFLAVLDSSQTILSIPVYVAALAGTALLLRHRRRASNAPEDDLLVALACGAALLMIGVGLMTEAGFAGNLRYVVLPAALLCLVAGAGVVGVLRALPNRAATAVAALAMVGASVPYVVEEAEQLRFETSEVLAEHDFERRLVDTIDLAGGPTAVASCGGVFTSRYQVPAVAWHLHRHQRDIEIFPHPPGWTIAPRPSELSRDPRFERVAQTSKWIVSRSCDADPSS